MLKSDRNLFAKLPLIGSIRQIETKEMLSYSLGILSLSIATCEENHVKKNKANMITILRKRLIQ